jgi:hypothetical protein
MGGLGDNPNVWLAERSELQNRASTSWAPWLGRRPGTVVVPVAAHDPLHREQAQETCSDGRDCYSRGRSPVNALLWMLIGHAVADYPLQGDWLARAKNRTLALVAGETIWWHALAAHAAIHAGAVRLATGSWWLAGAEFVAQHHRRRQVPRAPDVQRGPGRSCRLQVAWAGLLLLGVSA